MSREDAAHLLRRAGFGGSTAEIDQLATLDRTAAVDRMLDAALAPPAPDPAFLEDPALADWEKHVRAQWWWLERMRTSPAPLVEKLTLFWHNHFVSAQGKLYDIRLLHGQNQLFRRLALGNYRDLTQGMAIDPAMLKYLDNETNRVGRPQENFGRELMELFTLGVGNYVESDVIAMSRAWTGHNLAAGGRTYQFYANRHDTTTSTLFGISRSWDGPAAIDEILLGVKADVAARFIVAKLWSWFAYPAPSAQLVTDLTAVFRGGGLELRPLLRAMFLRDEFWGATARYALVRTPVEFVVAALKAVGLTAQAANPQWYMDGMGQVLYDPPNVSGWKQNGYWVSTAGYWGRSEWARNLRWRTSDAGLFQGLQSGTAATAVQTAFDRFGIVEPSAGTRASLEAWFDRERTSGGRSWSIPPNLVLLTMLTPEFNVC
jgi:uncharacterized protein (DUF1800 family)